MEINRILVTCLLTLFMFPGVSPALEVETNGVRMSPNTPGTPCVRIAGEYPGFKIVASEVGKSPQVCFNSKKHNHLEIHHATFIAATKGSWTLESRNKAQTDAGTSDIEHTITFSHDFPPGPNGMVTVRVNLFGFFSTGTGVGSPAGNQVKFLGYFFQDGNYDTVAAPFEHSVGKAVESGVFDFGAKKKYLISAPRTLKGVLSFSFANPGDKLTLPVAVGIKLDRGA